MLSFRNWRYKVGYGNGSSLLIHKYKVYKYGDGSTKDTKLLYGAGRFEPIWGLFTNSS